MKKESIDYYSNNNCFWKKNILITGATGGIGSLLMCTLVNLGAKVIALVRDTKKLLEILEKNNINKDSVLYERFDFRLDHQYRETFTNIMLKLKGKLDIMLLCHGCFEKGEIIETNLKEFDNLININTRSIMGLMSLASPFLKHTQGNIVAISSLESFIPVKGSFLNTLSKSMVNSLIQNAALELASFGVRVNGVAPGVTNTELRINLFDEPKKEKNQDFMINEGENNILSKEVINPGDVVDVMLFLASDDAGFVTGEIIRIDNGYGLNHDHCFDE